MLTLSDLTQPAAVLAALDEFALKGQERFLADHGYGVASGYLVRHPRTGEWADSKAIAGVALGYQFPGSGGLRSIDFSGGQATVVRKLRQLGFEVQAIGQIAGEPWRVEEVALIVTDYLSMLTAELNGQAYNKSARRRALLARLPGRSDGSIEFKHCNISAVMLELGYPYVRGYKPRSNFQRQVLTDEVLAQVASFKQLDDVVLAAVQRPASAADLPDFAE